MGNQPNVFARYPVNYTVAESCYAHRRKDKQVALRFRDDDLIISAGELCNHGDAFPLG